jgi:hypothetical protein
MKTKEPNECKGTVIMPDGTVREIKTEHSAYVCKMRKEAL